MKFTTIILLAGTILASCSSKGLFSKKTQHEEYAEKLDKTGMDETPASREWKAAAVAALDKAIQVKLPYAQKGAFYNDKPRALGLEFDAKRGEHLDFLVTKSQEDNFVIYADLFRINGDKFEPVLSGDTNLAQLGFDVDETARYVLRLQPEISRTGDYQLSISKSPSLAFPIGSNKGKVGSYWGDSRDGGKRSHEGIDIFAPKKTPVLAAAGGYITGVNEGGIGGKVVWLRVANKNITLYHAHLDKQLVSAGQNVKKGDVLGLVGNTGNAKYTPSHLHFGVYTPQGPIDPFPFVSTAVAKASLPAKSLPSSLKLSKSLKTADGGSVKASTVLVPLAINDKGYIAELPGGQKILVDFKSAVPGKPAPKSEAVTTAKSHYTSKEL
jgi:murein DD-endopeptidase MepM/ murein hydrolase activator NlpD